MTDTGRRAAVFLPAELPRDGRIALWDPEGGTPPGASSEITVVRRQGAGGAAVRRRTVPAVLLSLTDALPLLARARHDPAAHPATRCWGAAALHALHLAARGRLLPGLTPADHDAWRAGPLDADDIAQVRAIAAAMPPEAHAVPLPGRSPLQLPEPEALVKAFLDAVVDPLPRTPSAAYAMGAPFAARAAQHLPGLREWAAEVAAGVDAGVRVSLRLDLSSFELFDSAAHETPDEGPHEGRDGDGEPGRDGGAKRGAGTALVQVHSLADPTHVIDAAALWSGGGSEGFGPRARIDAVLALRRAARVWEPLGRLLDRPVPDVLALSE
ncbi:ATP-dependent helicase, partial [Streptomyces albidochromogenes]